MSDDKWQNIPLSNIEGGVEWMQKLQSMSDEEFRAQLEANVAKLSFEDQAASWRWIAGPTQRARA